MKARTCLLFLLLSFLPRWNEIIADSGVLIPISEKEEPDAALLSLDRMQVEVLVDHQYAKTRVQQIFQNHAGKVLEGKYIFALPPGALISDFAVWDGVVRIPGVILERRKAKNLYQILQQQILDPGILQQGESEDPSLSGLFSVRVVPIPEYGTKRMELEYTEWIPLEKGHSRYTFPLKPSFYRVQHARELAMKMGLLSGFPIQDIQFPANPYPIKILQKEAHQVRAEAEFSEIDLTDDWFWEYTLEGKDAGIALLTYPGETADTGANGLLEPPPPPAQQDRRGYFFAGSLLQDDSTSSVASARSMPGRSVVLLMDTSLSMQWEKLERSYEALMQVLRSLRGQDRFYLALFNRRLNSFQSKLVPADAHTLSRAEDFVKAQMIEDGSDLLTALLQGARILSDAEGERYLVLISDGHPTIGATLVQEILPKFRQAIPPARSHSRLRVCPIIIGADANRLLLEDLAGQNNGFSIFLRETDSAEFLLDSFVSRLQALPLENVDITLSPAESFDMVYPLQTGLAFLGDYRGWIGRFHPSLKEIQATVKGTLGSRSIIRQGQRILEKPDPSHTFLPRAWAKARVDALLHQIETDGEKEEVIEEIIRLSKRYRFITPYTSFLAAPRALLRPRIIQPGDPLLRVRADESIVSITALFPFGLVKDMHYLATEKIWQTRFVAPSGMDDGRYTCRLILRDKEGGSYAENKFLVIDSRPPEIRLTVQERTRPGSLVSLRVAADQDTRKIEARLGYLPTISLRWNAQQKASTGELYLPPSMAPGTYSLQITAEDFAHNLATLRREILVQ